MKKFIATLITATTLTFGVVLIGCQSSEQKVEDAKEKVKDANQNLKQVQNNANTEAQKQANAQAWKTLKVEWENKIKSNEGIILDLRGEMKKSGRIFDPLLEGSIKDLEQKNKAMKMRIDEYDKNQSDWESFKREFSHDMDGLGKALNDLTVNNKK